MSPAAPLSTSIDMNPDFDPFPGSANRDVIFHDTDLERFPFMGIARTVHLVRLLNVALGVLTILGAYELGLIVASIQLHF